MTYTGTWFEKGIIKSIDFDPGDTMIGINADGWGFGMDAKYGVVPKAGDTVELFGEFGRPIKGVKINGVEVFKKSDEEMEEEHRQWCEDLERKRKDTFEKNKGEMDKRYEALPEEFRKKLDRLRAKNPDFRIQFESYELMVCEDAVKIANALKTPEEVVKFVDYPYDKQKELVPDINEGHSGNSFGMACQMANMYLKAPYLIPYTHVAMATLTGCEKAGCHPLTDEEKKVIEGLEALHKG